MKIRLSDILATLERLTAPPPSRTRRLLPWKQRRAAARRKRTMEKRSMAASERRGEEMKAERVASGRGQWAAEGEMMHQVILIAMEPGQWYARADVVNLTGFETQPIKAKLKYMRERGWLRREQNPDWDPKHRPGPQAIAAGEIKHPQWLYTLTELGEVERARVPEKERAQLPVVALATPSAEPSDCAD